jgi:hypothetical protein
MFLAYQVSFIEFDTHIWELKWPHLALDIESLIGGLGLLN